jgi:hypothetical protein
MREWVGPRDTGLGDFIMANAGNGVLSSIACAALLPLRQDGPKSTDLGAPLTGMPGV